MPWVPPERSNSQRTQRFGVAASRRAPSVALALVALLGALVVPIGLATAFGTASSPADLARYLPPAGAPYDAEEVRVRSFERHSLGGTVTVPFHGAPGARRTLFPAVVLVGGRSTQDRDGAAVSPRDSAGVPLYRPLYELADTLSRRGFVTLRVDDRGVGASTGSMDSTTTFDRSYDVRATIEYLRHRPDVDPKRIAVLGMSEGATIGGMIAMLDPDLGAVVLMGAPSGTGREIVAWQRRHELEADPSMTDASKRDEAVERAMKDWDARLSGDRWLAFFAVYDPVATARRVAKPVLLLQGDADAVVPPDGAAKLEAAFRSGGSDITVRRLPGMDHAFLRPADFPGGAARDASAYHLSADLRGTIADWLSAKLGGPREAPSRPTARHRSRTAR